MNQGQCERDLDAGWGGFAEKGVRGKGITEMAALFLLCLENGKLE
jgi:hypothetical protein